MMAEKNIQMTQRNTANTGWDDLFPKTKAEQVVAADGTTVAAHMADEVAHNRYGVATGTNTLVVTLSPAPTALIAGVSLRFKNTTANTGAVTLNINGLGAKAIVKNGGVALSAGNLKAGGVYTVLFDGTSFILQGEGGEYGTAIAADVLTGKTFGTENGIIPGTLTPGKKFATGTATSVMVGARSILYVTGLSFVPTLVVAYIAYNTYAFAGFSPKGGGIYNFNGTLGTEGGSLTAGGFSMTTGTSNATYTWYAYE